MVLGAAVELSLALVARQLASCMKCDLCESRNNAVPGEGSNKARIMLVGEAPGREEDLQRRPFVGKAGIVLDRMLLKVGLKREECFITNVVKCRPPANRKPSRREMRACYPYLRRQIEVIEPDIIVCLGNTAVEAFFARKDIPGRGFLTVHENTAYLFTVHPAACLRNSDYLPLLESHLMRVANYLKVRPRRAPSGRQQYME